VRSVRAAAFPSSAEAANAARWVDSESGDETATTYGGYAPPPGRRPAARLPAPQSGAHCSCQEPVAIPFISIIVALIVVGVILGLINSMIPMDARIKQILNGVVVIAVVLWLLKVFGIIDLLTAIHVGK